MEGGTIFRLVIFLLKMVTIVKSDGTIDKFVGEILSTFRLMSPTMIYPEDEAPEICWIKDWLLCLREAEHYEVAEHIHRLYIDRKQDSLIFLDHQDQAPSLLEKLSELEPGIFRWSSPVIMPIRFVLHMSLRLDSNIIFYLKTGPGNYNLIDIFAVKGGPNIQLDIGVWDKINGIRVHRPLGRWDRRRDLKQTEITNSVYSSNNYVILIPEENCSYPAGAFVEDYCNITQTDGFLQEKFFFITEGLNLSIKIEICPYEDLILEDGSWGGEIGVLERREADVFSRGLYLREERRAVIDFTLPISHDYDVLAYGIPKGRAPSMWAYINVFGVAQWAIFFAALMGIVLLMSTIHTISCQIEENSWTRNALSAIEMTFLFLLQSGNHLNDGHFGTRILSISLSLLTLLFFVYYANDITADMTSGPPPIPIKNFEDILTFGYRIIVKDNITENFFSNAEPGTARYQISETNLENFDHYYVNDSFNFHALEVLVEDPLALLFTDRLSLIPEYHNNYDDLPDWGAQYLQYQKYLLSQIRFLQVDGSMPAFSSFLLQKQSEFLGSFNYFLMKQNEHGISSRLFRKYHMPLYINEQFGLIEPKSLGYKDVMFLFILLGSGMLSSLSIAWVEMLRKKYRSKSHAKKKMASQIQIQMGNYWYC